MAAEPRRDGGRGQGPGRRKVVGYDTGGVPEAQRKALPFNPQMERALLGALYLWKDNLAQYDGLILTEDFDKDTHQHLHRALLEAYRNTEADGELDSAIVNHYLQQHGTLAAWRTWEGEIMASCETPRAIARYAEVVFDNAYVRHKHTIAMRLLQNQIASDEGITALQALEERRRVFRSGGVGDGLPGVVMATVQTQSIDWMWRGYLAYGKLAMLDGDPGQGKGLLTIDLTARKTRGLPMPGEVGRSAPEGVVMLTPEDDEADTIRPRLEAAGADLSRVRVIKTTKDEEGRERFLSVPRDVELIERIMRHDNARVLIIDPVTAVLDSDVKTKDDMSVRQALMPLANMAARIGAVVLLVRHLNKSGGENAMYRGGGSIGFAGLCRTTFLVGPHPEADNTRVFAPIKSNIGKMGDSRAYTIVADAPDAWPHIVWEREACDLKADDLLNARQSQDARDVLRILRDAGQPMKPSEIAKELGIKDNDETGQARIRQRCVRMAKHNAIVKDQYGKYSAKPLTNNNTVTPVTHTTVVTPVTVSQLGSVTGVTGVTGVGDVTHHSTPRVTFAGDPEERGAGDEDE